MPVVDDKEQLELNVKEQQIVAEIEAHVKKLADTLTDEEKKSLFLMHQLMYKKYVLGHNRDELIYRVVIIEEEKNKIFLNCEQKLDKNFLCQIPFDNLKRIKNDVEDDRDRYMHEVLGIMANETSVVYNTCIIEAMINYIQKIHNKMFAILKEMNECDREINWYSEKIKNLPHFGLIQNHFEFKDLNKYYFEIDEQMQLRKISRKSSIRFSIIYLDDQKKLFLDSGQERLLGVGGYGTVKKAVISNGQELRAVKIQNKIDHISEDNIVKERVNLQSLNMFFGKAYRPIAKKYYTVMELVPGKDIISLIKLNYNDLIFVAKIFLRAAEEIQKLHDKGNMHLDIKMENIMYDVSEDKCRIIDYSFMTPINGDEPIVMSARFGTKDYCPPELQVKKADKQYFYSKRTDIYAFGASVRYAKNYVPRELVEAAKKLTVDDFEKRPLNLKGFIATAAECVQRLEGCNSNKKAKNIPG